MGSQMPQVTLKGPKGVLRDLIGSLRTPRVIYLGPLKVLRGFQMYLKGSSEASRSPFWTLHSAVQDATRNGNKMDISL